VKDEQGELKIKQIPTVFISRKGFLHRNGTLFFGHGEFH
jgi:hypothetical protein